MNSVCFTKVSVQQRIDELTQTINDLRMREARSELNEVWHPIVKELSVRLEALWLVRRAVTAEQCTQLEWEMAEAFVLRENRANDDYPADSGALVECMACRL